jgi:hypothetical protein
MDAARGVNSSGRPHPNSGAPFRQRLGSDGKSLAPSDTPAKAIEGAVTTGSHAFAAINLPDNSRNIRFEFVLPDANDPPAELASHVLTRATDLVGQ